MVTVSCDLCKKVSVTKQPWWQHFPLFTLSHMFIQHQWASRSVTDGIYWLFRLLFCKIYPGCLPQSLFSSVQCSCCHGSTKLVGYNSSCCSVLNAWISISCSHETRKGSSFSSLLSSTLLCKQNLQLTNCKYHKNQGRTLHQEYTQEALILAICRLLFSVIQAFNVSICPHH